MLSVSHFLVIYGNTNFEVIKKFKSTLYTRHKVDLELNFGITYSFFLKLSEYGMDKFHLSSISRENSPLICAYKFEWRPSAHIYELEILTEFPLQVDIEAHKYTKLYMN